MSAQLLDGRALAQTLRAELHHHAAEFAQQHGRAAHLALLAVGEDAGALVFGQQVMRACRALGVAYSMANFAAEVSEAAIRAQVTHASNDPATDGVVVLLPLPGAVRQRVITEVLTPTKDVDGLGPRNAGNLLLGYPSFVPGTAEAVMALLAHIGYTIQGKHAVIVGRSNVGGKPVALQLLRHDATITLCHSHTQGLADITRTADILVVSTGRPGSVTGSMVQPGAVVLDAGIHLTPEGVIGDVDTPSVREIAGWVTPVPGGLGPLTHLMVIRHTLVGPTP
jgi:methylenetetrahydrofolate dehydrogenase (NADP+) / methenyltetrahydrofolate cyclohydrolase